MARAPCSRKSSPSLDDATADPFTPVVEDDDAVSFADTDAIADALFAARAAVDRALDALGFDAVSEDGDAVAAELAASAALAGLDAARD